MSRYVVAAAVAVVALATPAGAQVFESVGVRAAGMAGAFVAVADDATAVYWNPAGLAVGALASGVVEHSESDLGRRIEPSHGVGIPVGPTWRLQEGASTLVAVGVPPLGLSYYRLRATGFEGELTERRGEARGVTLVTDSVAVNLLQSLTDGVHVGASLRLVRGSAGSGPPRPSSGEDDLLADAADVARRTSWAFDADVGVLVARGPWRLALTARNLVAPSFDTPVDGVSLSASRQVRAGVALAPRDGTTLSLDVDLSRTATSLGDQRHVAVGIEQRVHSRVTVRGGARLNTLDKVRAAAAAGASLALTTSIWIDGQVTRGGSDAERGWGVGLRFGL